MTNNRNDITKYYTPVRHDYSNRTSTWSVKCTPVGADNRSKRLWKNYPKHISHRSVVDGIIEENAHPYVSCDFSIVPQVRSAVGGRGFAGLPPKIHDCADFETVYSHSYGN